MSGFVFNPQAQYLFGRGYMLNLGPPNQTRAKQYGTVAQFGASPAPLRVTFEIEKNMTGASANHSKIGIYNLSQESRMAIKKGWLVQLYAGYQSLLGLIFTGNVYLAKSDRHDADIVTSLECLDGGSAIGQARWDHTYPPGTTLAQVLTDVATAMSVPTTANPVGVNAGLSFGIPNVIFQKGFVAKGNCAATLDKLLKPQGLEWNVDNGCLNVIPVAQPIGGSGTALVLSESTGLIGVPSQNEYYTKFTSLLNPKLVPGALVQLQCENTLLNGFYKLRNCKFEGDSHDNKWQVECEASPMPNVVQSTNLSGQGFNYSTAVVA